MNIAFPTRPSSASLSQLSLHDQIGEILSIEDVALLLDCAGATVEELARKGVLPGVKLGRSWIIPKRALIETVNKLAISTSESRNIKSASKHRVAIQTPMERDQDGSVKPINAPKRTGRKRDPSKVFIFPDI